MRSQEQKKFLRSELFSMTLMATVQRGNTYRHRSTETERASFRLALRRQLEAISARYTAARSDATHEKNILTLSCSLSVSNRIALFKGRFRIGSAQKALNLWLKYLWCCGEIPLPPHCPFDARIIKKLPVSTRCTWTTLDSIVDYHALVQGARSVAREKGYRSLAEWELYEFNRA